MKIFTVVGARPQFVKAAVVSHALRAKKELFEFIVHTGQHFDPNMSKVFFDELKIPQPNENLGISGGTHGSMTGAMLVGLEKLMIEQKPDWVLVYGDTNSTLAGSLSAAKLKLPCAHVEAGLRSYNKNMPEEVNRVLTDHACDLLFAPTEESYDQLLREGIERSKIIRTGDVMLDATRIFSQLAKEKSSVIHSLQLQGKTFALCTFHRAENVDSKYILDWFVESLNIVSREFPVVFPLHPRTKRRLTEFGLEKSFESSVILVEPLGFLDFLSLQMACKVIMTDSGGLQKEAFFQKKPCVTIRSETEWVELLKGGHNRLVEPGIDSLAKKTTEALSAKMDWSTSFYGDGYSAEAIARSIMERQS